MEMPADPFLPENMGNFGNAFYNLYAGLVQGGFSEAYALDLVKGVLIAMMLSAVAASQPQEE